MKSYGLLIAFLFCFSLSAQSTHESLGGAEIMSIGYVQAGLKGNHALYGNVAGLTDVQKYGVNVGYLRRYNLNELSTISAAGSYNLDWATVGVMFSQFGYDEYSENKIGLGIAKKLFDNLSIGAMVNMLGYNTKEYGSVNKLNFEVGLQGKITKSFTMGAYFFSPAKIETTNVNDIPSRIAVGFNYAASKKANIYADITKNANRDPEFNFGVDYRIVPELGLRFGGNVSRSALYFGAAYTFNKSARAVAAYGYDNRLGGTPGVSLSYEK